MAKYLYNGLELPALPEWDKLTYPYAAILSNFAGYYLLCSSESILAGDADGYLVLMCKNLPITISTMAVDLSMETASWKAFGESVSGTESGDYYRIYTASVSTAVRWSNHDILNSDGTLHLAASDPIPVGTAPTINPLSMWMGWKAGNWVARQRGKAKQPVAYLYNGVRLPKLPEWAKTVYPYAVILSSQSTYANLIVSTVPLYYTPVKSGFSTTHRLGAKADGSMLAFVYDSTNDDEVKRTSFVRDPDRDVEGFTAKENVKTLTLTSPKWANYDLLYYADDTVCVTASEPVPVYD